MKITPKILSIPPYISAKWDYISSIRTVDDGTTPSEATIEIVLINGTCITVPHLTKEKIETIFQYHLEATEHEKGDVIQNSSSNSTSSYGEHSSFVRQEELSQVLHILQSGIREILSLIMKLGSHAVSSFGKALEHDPKNANFPSLTEEMRQKVRMLLHIVPKEDIMAMPAPEEGCQCMYCQISRELRHALFSEENIHDAKQTQHATVAIEKMEDTDEVVDEKELEFSEWIVETISDKLYTVRNKLDVQEEYRVFLGNPIGCTCGKPNCEHIIAVLRS